MTTTKWSSRFAFIMATTGAAVGLGNIWKFPYMAGSNGGGAFVFYYLVAVVLIGIPLMMAEILLGRLGKANSVDTFRKLSAEYHHHPAWQLCGWWGLLGLVLVLSFYSVVAGWSVAYFFKTASGSLQHLSHNEILNLWDEFLNTPWVLIGWHTFFMFITLGVVAKGVQKGIERASKIMMPGLFIILLILMIYSCIMGDFKQAFEFLLMPHFNQINPSTVIYALGHAFFTLAIGAGCMLVYGGYLPNDTRIGPSVCIIASLDVLVALLAGFAIFPLVFHYQLNPESGPGLMFKVLPMAFVHMPYGIFIGSLFFILLWFAAWSSTISMAEPMVVLIIERLKWSRTTSSALIGLICWIVGLGAALSFNVLKDFKLLGRFTLFDAMADLTTNIILPLGGLAFIVFTGWKLPKQITQQGLLLENNKLFKIWHMLIKYICPAAIILLMCWNLK